MMHNLIVLSIVLYLYVNNDTKTNNNFLVLNQTIQPQSRASYGMKPQGQK